MHQNSIKLLLDFPYDTLVNEIIQHTAYTLAYSEEYEHASWVQYKLYKTNLELPKVVRQDKFKEDKKVRTGSATLNDYKGSGLFGDWRESVGDEIFFFSQNETANYIFRIQFDEFNSTN